jgi:hypothetical protein
MGEHLELDESKPRKLFIARSSNYAANCSDGYQGNYHNAHHIVPCTAINKSLLAYLKNKPPAYNKALARFTDWDVNAGYNLVGLPHKHAYEHAYKETTHALLALLQPQWKMAVPGGVASPMFPVHLPTNFGHIEYNVLVKTQLDSIWMNLNPIIKKHEPISATDMGAMIKAVASAFLGLLKGKAVQTKVLWKAGPPQLNPMFRMI